jgi:hypothetical protein
MSLKFIDAKQAKEIYLFKNIQRKLPKTTTAIWFNKVCRNKNLTPGYFKIQINRDNKQNKNTLKMGAT